MSILTQSFILFCILSYFCAAFLFQKVMKKNNNSFFILVLNAGLDERVKGAVLWMYTNNKVWWWIILAIGVVFLSPILFAKRIVKDVIKFFGIVK